MEVCTRWLVAAARQHRLGAAPPWAGVRATERAFTFVRLQFSPISWKSWGEVMNCIIKSFTVFYFYLKEIKALLKPHIL